MRMVLSGFCGNSGGLRRICIGLENVLCNGLEEVYLAPHLLQDCQYAQKCLVNSFFFFFFFCLNLHYFPWLLPYINKEVCAGSFVHGRAILLVPPPMQWNKRMRDREWEAYPLTMCTEEFRDSNKVLGLQAPRGSSSSHSHISLKHAPFCPSGTSNEVIVQCTALLIFWRATWWLCVSTSRVHCLGCLAPPLLSLNLPPSSWATTKKGRMFLTCNHRSHLYICSIFLVAFLGVVLWIVPEKEQKSQIVLESWTPLITSKHYLHLPCSPFGCGGGALWDVIRKAFLLFHHWQACACFNWIKFCYIIYKCNFSLALKIPASQYSTLSFVSTLCCGDKKKE